MIGLLLLVVYFAVLWWTLRWARKDAFGKGFDRGYEVGKREVDNWWCGMDEQASRMPIPAPQSPQERRSRLR